MAVRDLPSRETLEEVPAKIFDFLMGVGESVSAGSALTSKGFTEKEHSYAWTRLQKLAQFPNSGLDLDKTVRAARVEINAWDGPHFQTISDTLMRDHPEQAEFLFDNLEASDGEESVGRVETLLDRLDILESGQGREATRDKDTSALGLLATRGYTSAERQRLRSLVNIGKRVAAPSTLVNEQERSKILTELFRWYAEWTGHARNSITARSTRIRLGIAERRTRKADRPVLPAVNPPNDQPANGSSAATAPKSPNDQPTAGP